MRESTPFRPLPPWMHLLGGGGTEARTRYDDVDDISLFLPDFLTARGEKWSSLARPLREAGGRRDIGKGIKSSRQKTGIREEGRRRGLSPSDTITYPSFFPPTLEGDGARGEKSRLFRNSENSSPLNRQKLESQSREIVIRNEGERRKSITRHTRDIRICNPPLFSFRLYGKMRDEERYGVNVFLREQQPTQGIWPSPESGRQIRLSLHWSMRNLQLTSFTTIHCNVLCLIKFNASKSLDNIRIRYFV